MWPFPNASEKDANYVKQAAEEVFGKRNFGTVEFENFNKAWFVRVTSDRDMEDMPSLMIEFINRRLR